MTVNDNEFASLNQFIMQFLISTTKQIQSRPTPRHKRLDILVSTGELHCFFRPDVAKKEKICHFTYMIFTPFIVEGDKCDWLCIQDNQYVVLNCKAIVNILTTDSLSSQFELGSVSFCDNWDEALPWL